MQNSVFAVGGLYFVFGKCAFYCKYKTTKHKVMYHVLEQFIDMWYYEKQNHLQWAKATMLTLFFFLYDVVLALSTDFFFYPWQATI